MRALIVDDDRVICRCLQTLIDWKGLDCEEPLTAYNGREALTLFEQEKPDIVISDVRMPGLDGRALCEHIHALNRETAFIFLSAYEDFQTAQMAIRCNAKGYVLKPVDRQTLKTLEELIRSSVVQRENRLFYRQIVSGEYRSMLMKCIEEHYEDVLEGVFSRLEAMGKDPEADISGMLHHLIVPLMDWRCVHQAMNPAAAYEAERALVEEMSSLTLKEKISCLRNRYKSLIDEEKRISSGSDVIWAAQNMIRQEFASPDLDVHTLAGRLHMSPVYLGRVFIERTGMKLTDYITECRLHFACEQLCHTTQSVKEIAAGAGYADANYFTKVFRQKMDMTPLEYRAAHRSEG